jgi:hypothetical protein
LESVTSGEITSGEAPQKIRLTLIFLISQLHLRKLYLGKPHRERAVTEKNFQALPTQTDITVALIYKMERMINLGTASTLVRALCD